MANFLTDRKIQIRISTKAQNRLKFRVGASKIGCQACLQMILNYGEDESLRIKFISEDDQVTLLEMIETF
jgi:hypothetical protein